MFTKQISKVVKRFRKPNNYGSNSRDQNKIFNRRRDSDKIATRTDKSFKCRQCEGNDQTECPNCLKRQKKSLTATLANDESDSNSSEDDNN